MSSGSIRECCALRVLAEAACAAGCCARRDLFAIVYLPILSLSGIEGKMFRPMALTVLFALAGSLVLSITLIPVLASMFLPRSMSEEESPIVAHTRRRYEPLLRRAMARPAATGVIGVAVAGAVQPASGPPTYVVTLTRPAYGDFSGTQTRPVNWSSI